MVMSTLFTLGKLKSLDLYEPDWCIDLYFKELILLLFLIDNCLYDGIAD